MTALSDHADLLPEQPTLAALFARQAETHAEEPAVREGNRQLLYRELAAKANLVATRLRAEGVQPGAVVGLRLERSLELVVAVLGIIRAGACYLPIDPASPAERTAAMLREAAATLVLTREDVSAEAAFGVPTRSLPGLLAGASAAPEVTVHPGPEPLAYIMFTSGSTGQPKGVEVTQRAVANLVCGSNYLQITPQDVVALAANPAFDACTFELWGALLNGACLSVLEPETLLSPYRLAEALPSRGISILFLTTPLFHALAHALPTAFGTLRALLVGGDALDPSAARKVLRSVSPPGSLINGYGPTETTVFALSHAVREVPDTLERIPIGTPLTNYTAHVLDEQLRPVAAGQRGELFLGGPGLARGYLASPELTAERFLQTPWGRLYKTGDLARRSPEGVIDFLGRQDQQVKHRGFRIELAEIEAALRQMLPEAEVRVLAREISPGVRQLLAYLCFRQGVAPALPRSAWATELGHRVPEYMVPDAFIEVPDFPLTANGKLQLENLPMVQAEASAATPGVTLVVSTLHGQLLEIWKEVLQKEHLGIHDDFFEVGGHSLLAIRMLAQVEELLGVRIGLRTLFEKATVEHLAESLLTELKAASHHGSYIVLHPEGRQTPFFFLHGDYAGGGFFTRTLAAQLGPDRPFYAVHPHGLHGELPPRSIPYMARERVAEIRKARPHGPYLLGGYCNGGMVAFEMARQLEAAGEEVQAVIIFMASGLNYRQRTLKKAAGLASTLLGDDELRREQRFLQWSRRRAAWRAKLRSRGAFLADLALRPLSKAWPRLRRKFHASFFQASPEPPPILKSTAACWNLYNDACEAYVPEPFQGRLILLWPREQEPDEGSRPDEGWRSVSPQVDLIYVPGDHDTSITCASHLAAVGREMQRALRLVEAAPRPSAP